MNSPKHHKQNQVNYKIDIQFLNIVVCILICCVVWFTAFPTIGSSYIANSEVRSQKLFLNLANVTNVYPVAGADNNFFRSPENLSNEKVWSAIADIGIPVLRFPGGEANWYDWKTGTIMPRGRVTFGYMAASKPKPVSMDTFMFHARKVGASVSYALNIMDSPESIRELAFHWQQTNAPVQWVEMGSEHYHQNFWEDIGGPTGYLQRSRQALQALRAGGFQGPVGLGLAPNYVPGRPDFGFGPPWNQEIAKAYTQDFDAVILHYYPNMIAIGFEETYQEGPVKLITSIQRLREQFPGKQVWVTEWNIGQPPNSTEHNSLVHAIFDLRMLRALMDARVPLACYHVLTGTGWEMLGPDRLALEYINSSYPKMLRRVPYFAFKELLEAQKNSLYMAEQLEVNGIEFMAFLLYGEIRILAWTRNTVSTHIDINLPGFTTQFLGGEIIRGKLLDKNGSLLRYATYPPPWVEKILPTKIYDSVLNGPGIVLLRFSAFLNF